MKDNSQYTILLVDDENNVRYTLARILQSRGFEVKEASQGREAMSVLATGGIQAIVSDHSMPGMTGLELLKKIRDSGSQLPFILMTAYGSEEVAVDAMKCGASDYLKKPFPNDALIEALGRALKQSGDQKQASGKRSPGMLVGSSDPMKRLVALLDKVKGTDATVLILGESGTGKELVARALHYGGERAEGPFVTVNCGAIPEDLIESELFGHEEGSFTGAHKKREGLFKLADGGTIFLDEVGDLPLQAQVKLLRVLEDGFIRGVGSDSSEKVDVRVVAATNANLHRAVESKTFREDLFFRLNTVALETPPLRERVGDIPMLMEHFLEIYTNRHSRCIKGFTKKAAEAALSYEWPGNVRELEKAIERAVIMCESEQIDAADMPASINRGLNRAESDCQGSFDISGEYQDAKKRVVEAFERKYFEALLKRCEGNISMASRLSGMDRKSIYRKLEALSLR